MPTAPHKIRAIELHDDGRSIAFDAADWFSRATCEQIRELQRLDYFLVACEAEPGLTHCSTRLVIVDSGDAEAWLAANDD